MTSMGSRLASQIIMLMQVSSTFQVKIPKALQLVTRNAMCDSLCHLYLL